MSINLNLIADNSDVFRDNLKIRTVLNSDFGIPEVSVFENSEGYEVGQFVVKSIVSFGDGYFAEDRFELVEFVKFLKWQKRKSSFVELNNAFLGCLDPIGVSGTVWDTIVLLDDWNRKIVLLDKLELVLCMAIYE